MLRILRPNKCWLCFECLWSFTRGHLLQQKDVQLPKHTKNVPQYIFDNSIQSYR